LCRQNSLDYYIFSGRLQKVIKAAMSDRLFAKQTDGQDTAYAAILRACANFVGGYQPNMISLVSIIFYPQIFL
jgi:hypothetical protein